MIESLLLTVALAWLSVCESPQFVDPSVQAVYLVGNNVVADDPVAEIGSLDDEMCCDEPVIVAEKPTRCVAVEFRLIHASSNVVEKIGPDVFLSADQVRGFLTSLQNDLRTEVIAAPKMILCSGQEGCIKIGSLASSPASLCCDQLKVGPATTGTDYRVSVGGGIRIAVPMLGPVPIALDFGMPISSSSKPTPHVGLAPWLKGIELKATPLISADGRHVHCNLEGTTSCCPNGQCAGMNQTCTSRVNAVCADGGTIVWRGAGCAQVPVLSDIPLIGEFFQINGTRPESVVMMATVRIVNDAGDSNEKSTCTRDGQSFVTPPACCAGPEQCATVESNLAKLQTARDLFELAQLYERLNLGDVAQTIHSNVVQVCPGSRIACQAQEHCQVLLAQTTGKRLAGEEEAEAETSTKQPKIQDIMPYAKELRQKRLERIMSEYQWACSNRNVDRARQLAIEALAIDPTCFGK